MPARLALLLLLAAFTAATGTPSSAHAASPATEPSPGAAVDAASVLATVTPVAAGFGLSVVAFLVGVQVASGRREATPAT